MLFRSTATVTIVDNAVRALPNMVELVDEMIGLSREELEAILEGYENEDVLRRSVALMIEHLRGQFPQDCGRRIEHAEIINKNVI